MYHEAIVTQQNYLRICSQIERQWLQELAPQFVQTLKTMAPSDAVRAVVCNAFPAI